MIVAPLSPRFVHRFGTKYVVAAGMTLSTIALLVLSLLKADSSYPQLVWRLVILSCGLALTMAPATESIMGSLPPAKAGVGSAVNDTTRQTGGALGVAVIGSVFAARFHSVVGSASEVPAASRAAVKDSIGAALDAARNLPASEQAAIRAVVDHAYLVSMRLAYGLAAGVILLAAVVTWRYLPAHAPDEGDEQLEVEEVLAQEQVPVSTG